MEKTQDATGGDESRASAVDSIDKAIGVRTGVAGVDGLAVSTLTLAAASLLWFIASRPNLSDANIVSALQAYTAAFVMFQCVKFFLAVVSNSKRETAAPRIVAVWVRRLHHGPVFVCRALHGLVLALVAGFTFEVAWVVRAALIASMVAPVLTLTHAYWPVTAIEWTIESAAIPKMNRRGYAIIGGLIVVVCMIGALAAIGACMAVHSNYTLYTMETLRLFLVFIALVLVANRVAWRIGEANVLGRLVAVRDEVQFGRISPELGLARARLMLIGGDLADFVQPELEAVASNMAVMRRAMATLVEFTCAMGEAFGEAPGESIPTAAIWKKTGFGPERLKELQSEIASAQRDWDGIHSRLRKKANLAAWSLGGPNEALKPVMDELDRQARIMREERRKLHNALVRSRLVFEEQAGNGGDRGDGA